jgi:D-alanine-D-alanine ligase
VSSPGHNVVVLEVPNPARPHAAEANASEARIALRRLGHCVRDMRADRELVKHLMALGPEPVVPCVSPGAAWDGALQELLENIGTPYVGASAAAVRLCTDKVLAKHLLGSSGLPVLRHRIISNRAQVRWPVGAHISDVVGDFGKTVVIKSVRRNAAPGIRFAARGEDLWFRVNAALTYDSEIMIEPLVSGRLLQTVVVGPPDRGRVIGVAEVSEFVSGRDSPSNAATRTYRPAVAVPRPIIDHAEQAYAAVGCRDIGAVHLLLDQDGRDWILGVGTALDFAPHGPVACAAASAGLTITDVVSEMGKRLGL